MSPTKLSERITFGGVSAPGKPGLIVSVLVLVDGQPWPPPEDLRGEIAPCDADDLAVRLAWLAQQLIDEDYFGPPPAPSAPSTPAAPALAGVRFSLARIAQQAVEGLGDPAVRSWTENLLEKVGGPMSDQERARAIYAAIRREHVWVPDPQHPWEVQLGKAPIPAASRVRPCEHSVQSWSLSALLPGTGFCNDCNCAIRQDLNGHWYPEKAP